MPSSNWTETANSISLAPITTSLDGSSPENVNYLNNSDKITLMAQYAAALATKTSLDEQAATLGVSSAAYDTAVGNISTALIGAGAPANWATAWPDGTTSGPWINIQGNLANLWAQVASQTTALQAAISSANAAGAKQSAIAAALALLPGQSIVPNGAFGTGDTTGWVSQTGASVASLFGSVPDGAKGFTIPGANTGVVSHSFPVTQGQIYALTYSAYGAAGNSGVYLRIYYSSAPLPNVLTTSTGYAGYNDVLANGSLPTALPGTPTQYQWTAPAGATFASVVVVSLGSASIYVQGVQVIPYVMAQNILAGTITAGCIAAGAITADMITAGTLNAAEVTVTNLNASNITTGTLAATKVLFSDGTSVSTANRIITTPINLASRYIAPDNNHYVITGLSWSVTAKSTLDTFNFNAILNYVAGTGMSTPQIMLVVDGGTSSAPVTLLLPTSGSGWLPVLASVTGLAAGAHTLAFYVYGAAGYTFVASSYALCQQIY